MGTNRQVRTMEACYLGGVDHRYTKATALRPYGFQPYDLGHLDSELAHANSSSALFRNSRCPIYDGYRMGGLEDETAEALCQKGATAKLGSMLKQLGPNITYRLKHYRVKPDESCEEEILRV